MFHVVCEFLKQINGWNGVGCSDGWGMQRPTKLFFSLIMKKFACLFLVKRRKINVFFVSKKNKTFFTTKKNFTKQEIST